MPSIAKLEAKQAFRCTTENGTEIRGHVYPNRILGKHMTQLMDIAQQMKQGDLDTLEQATTDCAAFLAESLADWDLTEDDEGTIPVPLTVERLVQFGLLLLVDIMGALLQSIQLSKPNGTRSPQRSSPTRTKASKSSSGPLAVVSRNR